jgi:ribonuclease J
VSKIEIIPLGGIGEFGMNCMGIRYDGEMIVIDVGMGFPEETPYGVDISIPDFDYLNEYKDEISALILTHGHEDHIGALPYFLKKFNVPVYASRFTIGLAEKRLVEHNLMGDIMIHRVDPNQIITIGDFKIEFIHASHSLVDCFSLAIETPEGTIIHTGDYKIDDTPVIGKPYDLKTLARYGDKGVLALLSDSTNATVAGRTPSERDVIPAFEEIFAQTEGRIIVSTFASSIHRLQIVFDVAHSFGRKVCPLGRSMLKNLELAIDMGLVKIPDRCMIELGEARQTRGEDLVYLVTGSQAESRAVLWQLATSAYKGLAVEKGDTVVLSARIIPGNEKGISRLIGGLYKRGANIIEEKRRLIHVSGHASQEDIKIMTETAKPKFVVPIHGEYRMLFRHGEFVKNHCGYNDENVILIENGNVLELTANSAQITARNVIHKTFIDDEISDEVDFDIIRERKKLANSGTVNLVVAIDKRSRELITEPTITTQGVAGLDDLGEQLRKAREMIRKAIEQMSFEEVTDKNWFKENLRIKLKQFIQKEVGAKPVIIPTVVEV